MVTPTTLRVAVGPVERADIEAAVADAGATVATYDEADSLVWTGDDPAMLKSLLRPGICWVQLCAAGIDSWLEAGVLDRCRIWTAAKGIAAKPIAEHILCLMLAAARSLPDYLRADMWAERPSRRLAGTTVGIVGAGAIGGALIDLLEPFEVETIALTRTGRTVPGASRSIGAGCLDLVLADSDWVIVTAPATSQTRNLIDARALSLMRPRAWLVNVARGAIVNTDALVAALVDGRVGGAALDVTDPEPLPSGHPLWGLPNVIITPHVATTPAMHAKELCERVRENVRRFLSGQDLIGGVDLDREY
jgi:phosphoglycerate dehydrogenase-like enzyme